MANNIPDLNDIAENLAELLTNSVNIVDKYYDMFFNETPMLVELQQYNSQGVLETHYVPNLAKIKADMPNEYANVNLSNLTTTGNRKTVPSATGQTGKFLTNDGTTSEWNGDVANKDLSNLTNAGANKLVPDMTGMNGKLLTTDGVEASWSTYNMPRKLSDLINDTGFIDKTVRDLEYYTLTENLDGFFADKINQSKGLLTGNVSTVPNVLKDIKSYSHNNYDAAKFTNYIGGTPVISETGIMSNLANGNKVRVSGLQVAEAITLRFEFEYTWNGDTVTSPGYIARIADNSATNAIEARITTTAGQLIFSTIYGGATHDNFMTCQLTAGDSNRFTIDITATNVAISWYKNEALQNAITRTTALVFSNDYSLSIGSIAGQALPNSTSDLKRIFILKDGYEIFNGNKTGLDVIRNNNYTVTGSPTISTDGVVKGFSGNNYITISAAMNATQTDLVSIEFQFMIPSSNISDIAYIMSNTSNTNNFSCYVNTDKTISVYYGGQGTNVLWNNPLAAGSYKCKMIYTPVDKKLRTTFTNLSNGNVIQGNTLTTNSTFSFPLSFYVGIQTPGSRPYYGSLDLNSFKIYKNNSLVIQPCLRIPYTQSITGSKIVRAIYRGRVQDMYDQQGYAGYYTFSEVDFTLPMGEVYGMMGGIIDSTVPTVVNNAITNVLNTLYPVGSLYIGTQGTCPLASLIPGSTWTKVEGAYLCASGTLYGTSEYIYSNSFVHAGLPQHYHSYSGTTGGQNANHTHNYTHTDISSGPAKVGHWDDYNIWIVTGVSGSTWGSGGTSNDHGHGYSGNTGDAINSWDSTGTILGQSNTVRPETYGTNVWRRTA